MAPENNSLKQIDEQEMVNRYDGLLKQLNSDPNLHFVIRASNLIETVGHLNGNLVEMVLKKAALYARRAVFLTEPMTYVTPIGDHRPTAKAEWSGGWNTTVMNEVIENHSGLPDFRDSFFAIPERLEFQYEEWDNDEFYLGNPKTIFDFKTTYTNQYGVEMSFTEPNVNAHIFETLQCKPHEVSVLNIWLPQLSNLPMDILLKLRQDESGAFARFQHSLKQLIVGFGSVDSETKAKELFQRVDHEVREFETKMNQIRNARCLKTYEFVLGLSIMGLCFALPSEIAKIISSAIGIFSGKDFISHLFKEREQIYNLKSSEFYVPWLCTKLSKDE